MDLSHEIFALWESTIRRAFVAGVIANSMGPKTTAAVIWASMNGAFMLMGDDNFFRGVTGLNPEHFLDEALESHLAASQLSSANRNGNRGNVNRGLALSRNKKKSVSVGAVSTSRARSGKDTNSEEVALPAPA